MGYRTRAIALVAAASLIVAGCGLDQTGGDRAVSTIDRFMRAIAGDRGAEACRLLTPGASEALRASFGSKDCREAAARAVRLIRGSPDHGQGFRNPLGLPFAFAPTGPSPPTDGYSTARIRVLFFDSLLGTQRAVDVQVKRKGDGWRLDQGVGALFPNLAPARHAS